MHVQRDHILKNCIYNVDPSLYVIKLESLLKWTVLCVIYTGLYIHSNICRYTRITLTNSLFVFFARTVILMNTQCTLLLTVSSSAVSRLSTNTCKRVRISRKCLYVKLSPVILFCWLCLLCTALRTRAPTHGDPHTLQYIPDSCSEDTYVTRPRLPCTIYYRSYCHAHKVLSYDVNIVHTLHASNLLYNPCFANSTGISEQCVYPCKLNLTRVLSTTTISVSHTILVTCIQWSDHYLIPFNMTPRRGSLVSKKKATRLTNATKAAFFDLNDPYIVECRLRDCLDKWQAELAGDIDESYLLTGIASGFDILEGKRPNFSARSDNYRSATIGNKTKVQNQIKKELSKGNYIPVSSPPQVVSSLGAIPKDNGAIRLIHDLSRPFGGVNAYVEDSSVSYNTVDWATSIMQKGCYLSKIDLQSAYRSIPISPNNYRYMGLSWLFDGETEKSFMFDAKLPFGSRKACQIFTSITNAIARMLKRKGVTVVPYLDDILIISNSKIQNWLDLDTTVNLFVSLGFDINWDKLCPPTQELTFLGVEINTVRRVLTLPNSKLTELRLLIVSWLKKKRASKKELLSLAGKLNWACRVILGGRTFLRRVIDLSMPLRAKNHRTWLNAEARKDLYWWHVALECFHGFTKFPSDIKPPHETFYTDSCKVAGGGIYRSDWFHSNFSADYPQYANAHINVQELLTVLIAAERWGHTWAGTHVRVLCDNAASVFALNKGTSHSPMLMEIVRKLFWLSIKYNFRLSASHVRGVHNQIADMLSRLHQKEMKCKFVNMFAPVMGFINCYGHMSEGSFLCLQAGHS